MQTNIAEHIKYSPQGREADAILRKCVHCGFCLATCPTYSVRKNELESPRGRIYLIKEVLEGKPVTASTQQHLDSCLNCRSCETTCPASVPYHRLLEIGTQIVEQEIPRSLRQKALRHAILTVLPYRTRFTPALRTAQLLRPILPKLLKDKIPAKQPIHAQHLNAQTRKMLILDGCVQPALAPDINAATARVLAKLGISLQTAKKAGCCGAISYHLNQQSDGLNFMRQNIDAWWPYIEAGCEAIVMTASGCGTTVKEYGDLLKNDPLYAKKAARVSTLTQDLSEILSQEPVEQLNVRPSASVAFQCPCSLQHGQGLSGHVEQLLSRMGFALKPVADGHICCGSAGTYSIFQPELAHELREKKLKSLKASNAETYTSANIGCIAHLSEHSGKPVQHWIQLVDAALSNS